MLDFYPRSPCGERPAIDVFLAVWAVISIHALLAESDGVTVLGIQHRCGISIHALLAESDPKPGERHASNQFLSTLSLRRATPSGSKYSGCSALFLSTLSLRRATSQQPDGTTKTTYFYPRSPCGERRYWPCVFVVGRAISIHALLAESDRCHRGNDRRPVHFYPRSPCGERPDTLTDDVLTGGFLSTLSLRRATSAFDVLAVSALLISIHALLAESDGIIDIVNNVIDHFYPRSPCGERRVTVLGIQHRCGISIHALLAESDGIIDIVNNVIDHFYPRSPCGERLIDEIQLEFNSLISIHALLAESDEMSSR